MLSSMDKNENYSNSSPAIDHQNLQIQVHGQRHPSSIPIKIQEPISRSNIETNTEAGVILRRVFKVLFFVQLILITILVTVLTIRGLISARSHHFDPKKWFPPLLAATAGGGIVAFLWQWITLCYPSRAIRLAFWISPLLTCGVGVLLLLISSTAGFALGAIAIVFAVCQSLYTCWVTPRFEYATRVLSVSAAFPPAQSTRLVVLSIITGIVYSSLLVSGIGGARATGTGVDILFILLILGSLAWTMQVIKYTFQVTIARIKYLHFACGAEMEMKIAIRDTFKYLTGSVCLGSALVPLMTVIWGSARGFASIVGGTDEFLFSCVSCYSAVASTLVAYGNRWGFVQVGVYKKEFIQASMDTWEMFRRLGLEPLIDVDLTGSFCFLCGVAGGSISSLIAGSWSLAVQKNYATEVSIYAFIIGYFMTRVAMGLPQSCVSAYYVAYAESHQNPRFDSTIPDRIQEIQRYRV